MMCLLLTALSREENAIGRLLKAGSEHDKTRAGKMMGAVSKAQNFSSQQLYVLHYIYFQML
jgi:islet cell auto antigen 1